MIKNTQKTTSESLDSSAVAMDNKNIGDEQNYFVYYNNTRRNLFSRLKNIARPWHLMSILLCAMLALLIICSEALAEQPSGFKLHGRFQGIGDYQAAVIGPGPKAGAERLYASHFYQGDTFDIVATDPLTGQTDVFSSPLPGEFGAYGLVLGPDGQIYIGTMPTAHLMRVDWKTRVLVDLGRASITEQTIWQLAVGNDKKIYGCTNPNAKLVRFDPATGAVEDLGRMSQTEDFARYVATDDKGFVYVGIGYSKRDLVAYKIDNGQHRSILPQDMAGQGLVNVIRGIDGIVYAKVAGNWLRLDGFNATRIVGNTGPATPPLVIADGRKVTYDGHNVAVQNTDGKFTQLATGYRGKNPAVFRLGLGPDDRLYGSTALPSYFFWASPESDQWEEIANLGNGEIYSFLAWQDKLIGAGYALPWPIMIYKPNQPWNPGTKPENNPWQIHYKGENAGWRPMALIAGPQAKVYIGTMPGYGLLGGSLCVFDPITGKLDEYQQVIRDQSVVALAVTTEGMIVGGTTVAGGGGSHPNQPEAKLFLWDPVKHKKLFETVAASGCITIDALGAGKDGLIYGFTNKSTMFVFDARARKIITVVPSVLGRVFNNAIGRGPDGNLYGLSYGGIFAVDEQARRTKRVAVYPPGITGGFAIRGEYIFFTSGAQIVSYRLPLSELTTSTHRHR